MIHADNKRKSPGEVRPWYTYRCSRRNRSVLGLDGRDWYGVEAKPPKEHPPLVKITSKRGEVSYRELWE